MDGQTGNLPTAVPEYSLGWGILAWAEKYIVQPDGPNAGTPWTFTDEQIRFVVWLYAIDGDGKFVYRGATLRRSKGWLLG